MTTKIKYYLLTAFFTLILGVNINAQQAVVEVNQDDQIDELLELKKDINRRSKNFKIQIYNGSRSGAENTRMKFRQSYSEWPVSMEYETPNYKIWVGNFRTRLEADRALIRIKKKFGNAFIFKPKKK
ncbi:MAG: SPOR domain-containing protein [Flavobacteriaceae bacterium]|nr:SPOR domain-containing protein [Flavobacteriaceae bacterium]